MNLMWIALDKIIKNLWKTILKPQPRFRSKKSYVFTEDVNKIVFSDNDNKRIESIESYAYRKNKETI